MNHYTTNGQVVVNGQRFWRIDCVNPETRSGIDFLREPYALVRLAADAALIIRLLNAQERGQIALPAPEAP